jgi:hypothetical protein
MGNPPTKAPCFRVESESWIMSNGIMRIWPGRRGEDRSGRRRFDVRPSQLEACREIMRKILHRQPQVRVCGSWKFQYVSCGL